MAIDLNCDAGEAFGAWQMGEDATLIPLMTSVNIACGGHAGDPLVMRRTLELAARHGVAAGAHPGYPDLAGFGRRALPMPPAEVELWLLAQMGALAAIARSLGITLRHVKPHGALYNVAADEEALAQAIARAVVAFDAGLVLVALAGSALVTAGHAAGLRVAEEAFVDRGYDAHGRLVPRGMAGSLLPANGDVAARAVALARGQPILAQDGTSLTIQADTLCIHSDTAGATAIAQVVRAALGTAGVAIGSFSQARPTT
ncbi:MAG: LamB/YcsF family protein [Ktedonobacterales bacterium]|nr:LamB/YcsF family protein [Ktedonobacterales bacterium]